MQTRTQELTEKLTAALAAKNFREFELLIEAGADFNLLPREGNFVNYTEEEMISFANYLRKDMKPEIKRTFCNWFFCNRGFKLEGDNHNHVMASLGMAWNFNNRTHDEHGKTPLYYYFSSGYKADPDNAHTVFPYITLDKNWVHDAYEDDFLLLPFVNFLLAHPEQQSRVDLTALIHEERKDTFGESLFINCNIPECFALLIQLLKLKKTGLNLNYCPTVKDTSYFTKFLTINKQLLTHHSEKVKELVLLIDKIDLMPGLDPDRVMNPLGVLVAMKLLHYFDLLIPHSAGVNFNLRVCEEGDSELKQPLSIWLVINNHIDYLVKYLDYTTVPIELDANHAKRGLKVTLRTLLMRKKREDVITLITKKNASLVPSISQPVAVQKKQTIVPPLPTPPAIESASVVVKKREKKRYQRPVEVDSKPNADELASIMVIDHDQYRSQIKKAFCYAELVIQWNQTGEAPGFFSVTYPSENWTLRGPHSPFETYEMDNTFIQKNIISRIIKHMQLDAVITSLPPNQLIIHPTSRELSPTTKLHEDTFRYIQKNAHSLNQPTEKEKNDLLLPPQSPEKKETQNKAQIMSLPLIFKELCLRLTGANSSFDFLLKGKMLKNNKYFVSFNYSGMQTIGSCHIDSKKMFDVISEIINKIIPDAVRVELRRGQIEIVVKADPIKLNNISLSDLIELRNDYTVKISSYPADLSKGTNTSDHTYQAAEFKIKTTFDVEISTLRGFTWNLLDHCMSKKDNQRWHKNYWNNPWDITESAQEYLHRKRIQLTEILTIIKNTIPAYDFFFLQEVDIFGVPNFLDIKYHAMFYDIQNEFIARLRRECHWDFCSNIIPGQKSLVTLYNTKTLSFTGYQHDRLNRTLFECEFRHANMSIMLTNMHLSYNNARKMADLKEYLHTINMTTLFGGDTNTAMHADLFLTHHRYATNLERRETEGTAEIRDIDENGKVKTYDCFGAHPARDKLITLVEAKGKVFYKDSKTNNFMVATLDPQKNYPDRCVHNIGPAIAATPGVQLFQSSEIKLSHPEVERKSTATRAM